MSFLSYPEIQQGKKKIRKLIWQGKKKKNNFDKHMKAFLQNALITCKPHCKNNKSIISASVPYLSFNEW